MSTKVEAESIHVYGCILSGIWYQKGASVNQYSSFSYGWDVLTHLDGWCRVCLTHFLCGGGFCFSLLFLMKWSYIPFFLGLLCSDTAEQCLYVSLVCYFGNVRVRILSSILEYNISRRIFLDSFWNTSFQHRSISPWQYWPVVELWFQNDSNKFLQDILYLDT